MGPLPPVAYPISTMSTWGRQGERLRRSVPRRPEISGSRPCPGKDHTCGKRISNNKRWCAACAEPEYKKMVQALIDSAPADSPLAKFKAQVGAQVAEDHGSA